AEPERRVDPEPVARRAPLRLGGRRHLHRLEVDARRILVLAALVGLVLAPALGLLLPVLAALVRLVLAAVLGLALHLRARRRRPRDRDEREREREPACHRTRRDRHARALALHAPERRPRARGERLVHARVRLRASTAAISSAATTPVPGSSRFVATTQLAQPARLGLGPKYPSAYISRAGSPPAAAYLTRVNAGLIAT